ncbi:hypothetical protein PUR49_11185 [Streptomyces sp. BE147]|uniref:hypothetical protein n=1 Tax=Streptomyces sp. BE147 TaxID=3002524 RepID=UPI002E78A8C4|nr:hypothetical protein [Streptomyces sp. BE147]MEE1737059.1 hypothetical protein [Streptomyces sp. BE147]
MITPDAIPTSSLDYAVLGLSDADEVEGQWVTTEASLALGHLLACERAGLYGLVLELRQDGAVPLEAREITTRALSRQSGGRHREATEEWDPHAEAGNWLASILSATADAEQGTALAAWDVAAAKWAAYFRHMPSSEIMARTGHTDPAGWQRFRSTASELIGLLRHMDTFEPGSSTCHGERPLQYYVRGFQRLDSAGAAVPELRQAAEFFLLESVHNCQEAAAVAGFVGAFSEELYAWARDRFGVPERMAAAQARSEQWRARRQLNDADHHRASMWQVQHPSARRDRRLPDTWSAQRGSGVGPVGGRRLTAWQAERASTELQIEGRCALWSYLSEHEAELTARDPERRDRWLELRAEAERLVATAYVSLDHAVADLERSRIRVSTALESSEDGFAEFASEWKALQQATAALHSLRPESLSGRAASSTAWGRWQRSIPVLYRLVVGDDGKEDVVTSDPLAASLWWLRRDRPATRVSLSCTDALGLWQALEVRLLLQGVPYAELSTQQRAELDVALALWVLGEGERSEGGVDWLRMGRRWSEVLSVAPLRTSVLARVRALGHGKAADVVAIQQGAALTGDGETAVFNPGRSTAPMVPSLPDRVPALPLTVLLESSHAGEACYLHAALRLSNRTVVAAIRPTGEGGILADSHTADTSRLFTTVVERVSAAPESARSQTERQVVSDETAAFALQMDQTEQASWVAYLRDIEEEYQNGQATLAQYAEAAEQAWQQLVPLVTESQRLDDMGAVVHWYEIGPVTDASGPRGIHLDLARALCDWARHDRPEERFVIVTGEVAVPGRSVIRLSDVPVAELVAPDRRIPATQGLDVSAELAAWVHRQAMSTSTAGPDSLDSMAWTQAGWAWGLLFGAPMPAAVADELLQHGLPGDTAQAASRTVVRIIERQLWSLSVPEVQRGWLLLTAAAATWDEAIDPSRAYLDRLLRSVPADNHTAGDSEMSNAFLLTAERIGFIAQQSGRGTLGPAYRAVAQFGVGVADLTSLPAMPSRTVARAIEVQRRTPEEADRAFQAAEKLSQAAALLALYTEAGYPEHVLADLRQSVRDSRGYLSALCRQQAAGFTEVSDPAYPWEPASAGLSDTMQSPELQPKPVAPLGTPGHQ